MVARFLLHLDLGEGLTLCIGSVTRCHVLALTATTREAVEDLSVTIQFNYYPWLGLDFDNPLVCLPDSPGFLPAVSFVNCILFNDFLHR